MESCAERITYDEISWEDTKFMDSLLCSVDSTEIISISRYWEDFTYTSDSMYYLYSFFNSENREVRIAVQTYEGDKHYGAIILPLGYKDQFDYPVLVFAPGLNQYQPRVDLRKHPTIRKLTKKFPLYILVIPSYRGQELGSGDIGFCSDGFFGDAFDGATDDALRLLDGTLKNIQGADATRVGIYGISRGGTVALLAASRDKRIKAAISQAGPVDFVRKEVANRYRFQYYYQFLNGEATLTERRNHILRSSPIHFIHDYQGKLLILHGIQDKTVPLWNAEELLQRREADTLTYHEFWEAGHNFDATDKVKGWLKEQL
ncbi:MAG: prolyl oligopeptidase family serine peptidase [Bacteroidota bacterium]